MPCNWVQRMALGTTAESRRYKRGRVSLKLLTVFGTAYGNDEKAKVNTNLITNDCMMHKEVNGDS